MVRHEAHAARSLSRLCLLMGVCCVLASLGCRGSQQQVQTDWVHRQMRLQEDEIYRLEDYLEEYQALAYDYRCQIADLKRELAANKSEAAQPKAAPTLAPAASEPDALRDEVPGVMPEIEMPELEAPEPELLAPPAEATDTAEEAPPFDAGARQETDNPIELARAVEPVDDRESPPAPFSAALYPIAKPIDPPTGVDESLQLAIEPGQGPGELMVRVTDTQGASSGVISVMLTDPTVEGGLRRIARWDYTAEETAGARRAGGDGGAVLELPIALPHDTPLGQPLRLWVRLLDGRDRRLQATPLVLDAEGRPEGVVSDSPRRLPASVEASPEVDLAAAPVQPAAETGWRPARRPEHSVMTVSYDEPLE